MNVHHLNYVWNTKMFKNSRACPYLRAQQVLSEEHALAFLLRNACGAKATQTCDMIRLFLGMRSKVPVDQRAKWAIRRLAESTGAISLALEFSTSYELNRIEVMATLPLEAFMVAHHLPIT